MEISSPSARREREAFCFLRGGYFLTFFSVSSSVQFKVFKKTVSPCLCLWFSCFPEVAANCVSEKAFLVSVVTHTQEGSSWRKAVTVRHSKVL